MIVFSSLSAVLLIIGIALVLDLTPGRITSDLIAILTPKDSYRRHSRALRKGADTNKIYRSLMDLKNALASMGKEKVFSGVLITSLCLMAGGIILAALMQNPFLLPVLAMLGLLIPFWYASNLIRRYRKQVQEELEGALSVITVSYCRSNDLPSAIVENEVCIKPPLRKIFGEFTVDVQTGLSTVRALLRLREKIDNSIFREWCDAAIRCQDDRTLESTLLPIVGKFSDVRIVNEELTTMMAEVKVEYGSMVAMLLSVIPILYVINKDWFHTLLFTLPGKLVLAIAVAVILITAILFRIYTRPIEYKK